MKKHDDNKILIDLIQLISKLRPELSGQGNREPILLNTLAYIQQIRDGYLFLVENQNKLSDYWLASVAVGLGKYFSFNDMGWLENKNHIETLLDSITWNSSTYLNRSMPSIKSQICGAHEDGACIIAPMTKSCNIMPKNCNIPPRDIVNFETQPQLRTIPKGTSFFRVLGPNNTINGVWWFRDKLPQNKTFWRSQYAVLSDWNKDTYYVEFVANDNIRAWAGPAASQKVCWTIQLHKGKIIYYPNTQCILRGGYEQIWLEPKQIIQNLIPQKTGW